MLLEAWRIAQALKAAGIDVVARCADVATPGRTAGPALRVLIGGDLSVELVPVAEEELSSLWAFRKGNFHFWPVIRPVGPLNTDSSIAERWRFELKNAKEERSQVKRQERVAQVLAEGVKAADADITLLWDAHVRGSKVHEKKLAMPNLPQDLRGLKERIDQLQKCPDSLESAIAAAKINPLLHAALFALFYGKEVNGEAKGDGQVAFDLKEETLYTEQKRRAVESALATGGEGKGHKIICSIAGIEGVAYQSKFPNPSLPIVASSGIAMFSMFSEAETNFRYGRSDHNIVSISQETVQASHDAIVFATAPEYRGSYWRGFPNGKNKDKQEQSDLLIVYAEGVEAPMADGFGGGEIADEYEGILSTVLKALDGQTRGTPYAHVLIILLRQISNAQVQAVYCRTPLASEVLKAGRRWEETQKARPPLLCAGRKDRLISPALVVRLLSKQWAGSPLKATKLNGPSGGDIIDFMLACGDDRSDRATELLTLLLQRATPVFIRVAADARQNDKPAGQEDGKGLRAEADYLCRLIALILDAKERTLEDTTRSPAYLLGLLLGVVDTLHLAYCIKVRGDVPPSLGGSQLLGIASDDPTRALSDLLERIRPWHDWAETTSEEDLKIPKDKQILREAKEALQHLSAIAPHLAGRLPNRLDDIGKAELLLGFLSEDTVANQYRGQSPQSN